MDSLYLMWLCGSLLLTRLYSSARLRLYLCKRYLHFTLGRADKLEYEQRSILVFCSVFCTGFSVI